MCLAIMGKLCYNKRECQETLIISNSTRSNLLFRVYEFVALRYNQRVRSILKCKGAIRPHSQKGTVLYADKK